MGVVGVSVSRSTGVLVFLSRKKIFVRWPVTTMTYWNKLFVYDIFHEFTLQLYPPPPPFSFSSDIATLFTSAFYVAFVFFVTDYFSLCWDRHFTFLVQCFFFLIPQKTRIVRQIDDQIRIGELQKQQSVDHQVFLISKVLPPVNKDLFTFTFAVSLFASRNNAVLLQASSWLCPFGVGKSWGKLSK